MYDKQLARWAGRVSTVVGVVAAMMGLLSASASGETIGNNLWNLRENTQAFFGANDSWVRPWETTVDDGWGAFRGGHNFSFAWGPTTTSGNPADGSLSLNRGVDTQFHVWTFLYVSAPKTVSLTGEGDCVPRWFLNTQFNSPHEFVVGDPTDIILLAGWNRLDITGYNQVNGFLFATDALASQVAIMDSAAVPEPSTLYQFLAFLAAGGCALVVRRRSVARYRHGGV